MRSITLQLDDKLSDSEALTSGPSVVLRGGPIALLARIKLWMETGRPTAMRARGRPAWMCCVPLVAETWKRPMDDLRHPPREATV